ncbi:MAG: rod shape-determining protein MreD [Actinobacteria bacterium]|nr:rod shape-determining protein MreD [Actinomycetota bacterium]MCL6105358.1 rod shape-determining protein MreD [Actinomycetota bacterium]
MRSDRLVRLLGLVVTCVLFQELVLNQLAFHSVHPDILVLLAALAGLEMGPEYGSIVGFAAGVSTDLFVNTPFGLTALVYALVGFGVGALSHGSAVSPTSYSLSGHIKSSANNFSWWRSMFVGVVVSPLAMLLWVVLAFIIGQPDMFNTQFVFVICIVALGSGVMSVPVSRLIHWFCFSKTSLLAGQSH